MNCKEHKIILDVNILKLEHFFIWEMEFCESDIKLIKLIFQGFINNLSQDELYWNTFLILQLYSRNIALVQQIYKSTQCFQDSCATRLPSLLLLKSVQLLLSLYNISYHYYLWLFSNYLFYQNAIIQITFYFIKRFFKYGLIYILIE